MARKNLRQINAYLPEGGAGDALKAAIQIKVEDDKSSVSQAIVAMLTDYVMSRDDDFMSRVSFRMKENSGG